MYEIFANLLKEKGITANTVGKATGITSATFSSWKRGIYTPKREKMQKIADYLGVSVAYLMGTTDIPNATIEEIEQELAYKRKLVEQYKKDIEELGQHLTELKRTIDIVDKIKLLTPEQYAILELLLKQFTNN